MFCFSCFFYSLSFNFSLIPFLFLFCFLPFILSQLHNSPFAFLLLTPTPYFLLLPLPASLSSPSDCHFYILIFVYLHSSMSSS
uniref:Uncharacterized protein n=1 Tax=Octopus bimaculoides TaxID=37653 RepID=A0A0L8HGX3_OCTBM